MGEISLSIDNREVAVPEGSTILEAARRAGVKIPTLCHFEGLSQASACRVCLVEVQGARSLVAACSHPVSAGMRVTTDSARVLAARRLVVDLLLSDHPSDCMTCEKSGTCTLQDLAYEMGLRTSRFEGERRHYPIDLSNPFIVRDYNKCILCERCVRACNEIQGVTAIDYANRGFNTRVSVPFNGGLKESETVSSAASACRYARQARSPRRRRRERGAPGRRKGYGPRARTAVSAARCGFTSKTGASRRSRPSRTAPPTRGVSASRGGSAMTSFTPMRG